MYQAAFFIIIAWNIGILCLYGYDKYMAKRGGWRVSEKTLLSVAFMMGAPGAALGMLWFRHKIRKAKFKILVSLALVCNLAIVWVIYQKLYMPVF